MISKDVLIVGAGPTGLVLALWLTRQSVRVRIIDRTEGPGTTSRAMAVQARTLELYRQLDIADAVVAAGYQNRAMNIWIGGEKKARVAFGDVGADLTPYSFMLTYPQDLHERLLVDKLQELGVTVDRQTELVDFEDKGDSIVARLNSSKGAEECEARFIVGCDGASSTVRHRIGATFPGGTYSKTFYVADVEIAGGAANGEANMALEFTDFMVILAYNKDGAARLIGTVDESRVRMSEKLTFDDVGYSAIENLKLKIEKVNWFSTYRVHHRVTDFYRKGRAFLAGDAAHVHSPVGGQGMNTGIGDAINLAWKLAAVLNGTAPDRLLDSYQAERRAFAESLVATTDRVFTAVTAPGDFSQFVRFHVAPIIAPIGSHIGPVREFLFRIVSQTMIQYRESPISKGKAGSVHGGDRLPWVRVDGSDNYAMLNTIGWQAHVYGTASPELTAFCSSRNLPLHLFPFTRQHEKAGLERNACYLLRPDTYVGLATPAASVQDLEGYFGQVISDPRLFPKATA